MEFLKKFPRSPFRGRAGEQWVSLLRERPSALVYVVPWAMSRRAGRSALSDGVPWVPFAARRWLASHLSETMRAFEWGSGGSTLFLARRVREIVSIEHDAEWHRVITARLRSEGMTNCECRLIEPRPVGSAGSQFRSGQRGCTDLDFEEYVRAIEAYPDGHFDFIMIDGRARLACLSLAWSKVRIGGHILLDNSNYERYQRQLAVETPPSFERHDISGVSPYGGDVWTQSTIWQRLH